MDDWNLEPARDHGLGPLERMASARREPGLAQTAAHAAWWGAVRGYLALAHRLRVEGLAHLPAEPPFVLVANHSSHLDSLALVAALPWRLRPRAMPLAAADLFFASPARSLATALTLNALPMRRRGFAGHALAELRSRMEPGAPLPPVLVLFPEGTRSRDGGLAPFKPGLGMLVAGLPVPVVPCRLLGCGEAWPPERRLPRPRPVTLRIGAPLDFAAAANDRAGWESVAAGAEAAVRGLPSP